MFITRVAVCGLDHRDIIPVNGRIIFSSFT